MYRFDPNALAFQRFSVSAFRCSIPPPPESACRYLLWLVARVDNPWDSPVCLFRNDGFEYAVERTRRAVVGQAQWKKKSGTRRILPAAILPIGWPRYGLDKRLAARRQEA